MDEIYYDFNFDKNLKLKKERNISFEEIIASIQQGNLLDVIAHHNKIKYPHQKMYVVKVENYVYAVPFVEQEPQKVFLKTIFPCRKFTKAYLK